MAKHYFKNLDGLRFIAALTVAFTHLETLKQYRHIPFVQNRFFEHAAEIAVTFFFVLSGFLIMWWFLEETNGDTRKINIKKFYISRVSRTWPLYFLVVFGSIFIGVYKGTFKHDAIALKRYTAYLFFLPNTADVFFKRDIYLGPAWSLAVEECFYLFFPLLLLRIQKNILIKTLLILAVVFLVISTVFNRVFSNLYLNNLFQSTIIDYLNIIFERYRFYSFLLGSVVAVLLFEGFSIGANHRSKPIFWLLGTLLTLLFCFGITFSFFTHQAYSLLFAAFLFVIVQMKSGMVLLNNKLMIWGGKRSYSIYMLHMFIVLRLINQGSFLLDVDNKVLSILISWSIYLALVLTAAHFCYNLFESPMRSALRRLAFKTMKSES